MGKPRWLLSSWRFCAHTRTHTHQWSYPHCVLRAPLHDGDPGRRTMWKQVRITTQHIMSLPCIQDAGRLEKEVTNGSTFNDSGILPCQRWELLLHSHNSPLEKTLWLPPLQKGTLRHYEVSVSPRPHQEKQQVPEMQESLPSMAESVQTSKELQLGWLAGWVTTVPQQVLALPKQQFHRQDTEALHRLDTGACSPSLIVDFLPQVWVELSHESHSNADPSPHAEGQIIQQILFQISEQAFQKHQPLMFLLSTTASTTTFAPSLPHQTRFLEWQTKGP